MKDIVTCLNDDQGNIVKRYGRPFLMNNWEIVKDNKRSFSLQNFCLCEDTGRGLSLACISESDDGILQKELYGVGLLSPSSSKNCELISNVHQPCSIFLTHDSVLYLDSLPVSLIIYTFFATHTISVNNC